MGSDASGSLSGGSDGSPVSWSASEDGELTFCGGTWDALIDAGGYDFGLNATGGCDDSSGCY